MGFTETPTTRPYAPTTIFPHPTPITSQWTTSLKHELSPSYTLPPGASPATLSFEQLKAAYTHDNIIKDLGKLGAEDPHKQSSLAYANLRESFCAPPLGRIEFSTRTYLWRPSVRPKALI